MAEELQALNKTHTWDLVDLPSERCKQVYKIKIHFDCSVEWYKAHLIAKGFTQEYGIDYKETFTPVSCLISVQSLLVVDAIKKCKLFQMDIKNAFLNCYLIEEVYMQPLLGSNFSPNNVYKLLCAMYGPKQAPRFWFAKFSTTIRNFGFTSSAHDSTYSFYS